MRSSSRDRSSRCPRRFVSPKTERARIRVRTESPTTTGHSHTSEAPFIGREPELATLLGALGQAERGAGSVVTLVGDAGIGKTRTVEEFTRRAALPEGRVLWGRCPEQGGAPTYWPWRQVIRRHVEHRPPETLRRELGDAGPDVATLVPSVRDRIEGGEPPQALDPDQARFRLFDGIAGFLARVAETGPLVLVLDDLHWADHASLALLDFIGREVRNTRLLIVGTYREIEMRRAMRTSGALARMSRRVPLRGLDRPEVERFIAVSAGATPPDTLVARLHETTEGNPFFLGELVESLRSEGALDDPSPRLHLPDGVREATRRRLDAFTDDERQVLQVAAVAGREFDLGVLQGACELGPEALLGRLSAPASAGLVEQIAGRVDGWRFAHALIRETLYHDLLPAARAEVHRRIAHALEAGGREGRDAELAHHYYHAAALGEGAKAMDWSERAGKQALAVLAYDEAVAHYEHALAAESLQAPDQARRLALLLALGDAAVRQGDDVKAREAFERAGRVARALGAKRPLVAAALGLGRVTRLIAGRVDQRFVGLLEEALAALEPGDEALRVALLARLSVAVHFDPDPDRAGAYSAEAIDVARRLGQPGTIAVALLARVPAVIGPHPIGERMALVEEAERMATAASRPALVVTSKSWRITTLLEMGEVAAAEAELASFAADAERLREPARQWHAISLRACIDLLCGRLSEAGRGAAEALALRRRGSDANVTDVFWVGSPGTELEFAL